MAVKLHTCRLTWVKIKAHHCWRVEQALIDMGVAYERETHALRRSQRQDMEQLSGQKYYPVIELEDGTVWHDESKEMESQIRSGKLSASA